jgi:HEAT repeat protein
VHVPEVLSIHAVSTAANLAAVLLLLRDQRGRREQQVLAFRAFLSDLGQSGLDLRLTEGGMTVERVPVPTDAPGAEQLCSHLRGHGIGSVRFPAGLTPAAVLSVLRTLAMPPGHFGRLEQLVEDIDPATRALVHIGSMGESEAGEAGQVALPGGFVSDTAFMGAGKGPPPGVDALRYSQLSHVSVDRLDVLLAEVRKEPESGGALHQLNQIVAACDVARRNGELERVFRAAVQVAGLKAALEQEELRAGYQIALRRMLPREALDYVARRTSGPQRTDAIDLLRHIGAEASEALLHLLVESESMEERRAYRAALRAIATVSPLFERLLGHEEWYVIRNVADLCGDLRAEQTVPQLARHVDHADERVRRAVAGALAKIATPSAVEPLRHMLHDPSPQVRLLAVQGLDGPRARGLAMTLALALEDESNLDVQRELLLALGRIGTPDAVQALVRQAAPGRLFQRRPVSLRLAAIEGLRLAGTPAAIAALQGFGKDDEGEVRRTVQAILDGLRPA